VLIAQAYAHFVPFLLVATRLGGFFAFAPFFDSQMIPMQVKIALVIILAGCCNGASAWAAR